MSSVTPISVAPRPLDQPLPLLHHALHRSRPPGVAGHGLGAEGAFVGTAAAGEDGEAARVGIEAVGQRLQIGVAVDLEEIVGREGQRVQVRDHGAFRAGHDLVAAAEVDARDHARLFARLQRVHQFQEAVLGLALEGVVDVGVVGRFHGLKGHDRQVRSAEHGDHAARFAELRHLPRFLDQGRGGGDANQFVGLAFGLGHVQVELDAHVLDGGVVDHHIVAAFTQYGRQVAQAQGNMLARTPNFGFGTG